MTSAKAEATRPRKPLAHKLSRGISLYLFITLISFLTLSPAFSQQKQEPLTRMLFAFDASNSMNAFWGDRPKIETARELLLASLKELEGKPNLELALRLYGHQTPIKPGQQDCDDTALEVPFSPNSIPDIRSTLRSVR